MSVNLMEAHNQWANRPADQRFETLSALRESVHSRRLRSRSIDIDCARTEVKSQDGLLTINGTITPCEPTHWSFGQLAKNVKAPAAYLRTLPQDLVVANLNHGLKNTREMDQVKFMTIASEDGAVNTLQAVTSPTYGRVWDADLVTAVEKVVDRSGGKFHNPLAYAPGRFGDASSAKPSGLYASDRDIFIFMIDGGSYLEAGGENARDTLHRGFFTWNSEVGSRTIGICTFMHRGACGNHIIWGAEDVNRWVMKHSSGAPERFLNEAAPKLIEYCNRSASAEIATIKKAQDRILLASPSDKMTVENLLTALDGAGVKFTRSELARAIDFAKAEEGDCRTLWHVVQGLTAYARGFDFVDSRIDLETRAGKLLNLVA